MKHFEMHEAREESFKWCVMCRQV